MKRLLTAFSIGLVAINAPVSTAQWAGQGHSHAASAGEVPAYNAAPPAKGARMNPILKPEQLSPNASQYNFQKAAYLAAGKVADVLHQQPCYCYCDRAHGHNSLRTCFETEHGATCQACMAEALFAYQQTRKGMSAREIREAIKRGEWRNVDLRLAAAEVEADFAKKPASAAKKTPKKRG